MNAEKLDEESGNHLFQPISFLRPDYIAPSAWLGHIPFAFWLMYAVKPAVFVELGTHRGSSYAAFLQAAVHLEIPVNAFAVDTWKGDPHSGLYGDEIYRDFLAYHNPRYAHFSSLIRTSFDDAADKFTDGSIDLLHIDGYHTYDAVKHDFTVWLPKMSKRGVIIFHDINVRKVEFQDPNIEEFGAWRIWEELRQQYPFFEFKHSAGLGVLAVGEEQPPAMQWLTQQGMSFETCHQIQSFFSTLGDRCCLLALIEQQNETSSARENHIAALQHEISLLQQKVSGFAPEIQAWMQKNSQLETEINQYKYMEAEYNQCQHIISDLNIQTQKLQQNLIQAERDVLSVKLENQQLAQTLSAINSSSFWRMTKPLRLLLNHLPLFRRAGRRILKIG